MFLINNHTLINDQILESEMKNYCFYFSFIIASFSAVKKTHSNTLLTKDFNYNVCVNEISVTFKSQE